MSENEFGGDRTVAVDSVGEHQQAEPGKGPEPEERENAAFLDHSQQPPVISQQVRAELLEELRPMAEAMFGDPKYRKLDSHKVAAGGGTLNDGIEIYVLDAAGSGGANHRYLIRQEQRPGVFRHTLIEFQCGGIGEKGVNGLSNEALLAVVEDRLRGFDEGRFATMENEEALGAVRRAMDWLRARTRERVARGVEGREVQ